MKKVFLFAFLLAAFTLSCQQKQTQGQAADADTQALTDDAASFDIDDYLEEMSDNPELRYGIGDIDLKEYALCDIDGDGQDEVWVRDEDSHYLAIYVLNDGRPELVAYSDGCTDLEFYKHAVAYSAYYSPGRSWRGAQVVKKSRLSDCYWGEQEWDIFSDDQELTFESYYINGEQATEDECDQFVEKLGEPVEAPKPEWREID